jgi:hypothetical protein
MDSIASTGCDGLLLVDHANVPFESVSLRRILETWLDGLADSLISMAIMSVLVRAYGGWYRQSSSSDARFIASEYYQDHCPSLVRIGDRYCRVRFEFADTLLITTPTEVPLAIRHTVAVRGSPEGVVARQGASKCPEADCQLRTVKKWMRRKRACTKEACPLEFKDQFERHQQKQVDVHLATDILTWAYRADSACHLAIASDDVDLLPALGAAAIARDEQRTLTLIRFLLPTSYLDADLLHLGLRLHRI